VQPLRQQTGSDQSAQRHERHALLARLKRGMQGRTGRVFYLQRSRGHGGGKPRCRTELAEADGGSFNGSKRAGANEQVGLQARCRQRHEMESLDAASNERAGSLHGDARLLARHRQHAAIDNWPQRFVNAVDDHALKCSTRRVSRALAPRNLDEVRSRGARSAGTRGYDSACFTRSGENGTRRMRTPVASKIALAMAAATGRMEGSPAPLGAISGWLMRTRSIVSGVSLMSRMG